MLAAVSGRRGLMQVVATRVNGAKLVELDRMEDERGFFARLHCDREFAALGLPPHIVQTSLSQTRRRGMLRGLHFQLAPSREGKVVRCLRGRVFDVVLDLRPDSPSYLQHDGAELANGRGLYLPPGCAHGFQALEDDCLILYQMSDDYRPDLAAGVRWNDPAFAIAWPISNPTINERDRGYPDFDARLVAAFKGY